MLDDRASHARKLNMALCVAFEQFTNDLMHVAAGAEGVACASQHDNFDALVVAQVIEETAELRIDLKGQSVQHLWPVEGQCRHAVLHLIEKIVGHACSFMTSLRRRQC